MRAVGSRLGGYACFRSAVWSARFSRRCRIECRQTRQSSVLRQLEERGLVNQIAGNRSVLDELLRTRSISCYAGIDPTAPSLHLGHLLPLMVLFWLHHHGHHAISLIGGATAKVGDPTGRLTSRAKTTDTITNANVRGIHGQLSRLWKSAKDCGVRHEVGSVDTGRVELLDNAAWLDKLSLLHFLKAMGNAMRLGTMLGRDTVRNKMEKGDGMSFSEFTYPLLQGWDWWHMFSERGVQLQIGGSDQYGNIIAGIDGVKHIAQAHDENGQLGWLDADGKLKDSLSPMGLTVPLLTTSNGEKFGKSAGNAVWLDASLTSPFDLYGFLLRSSDDDVERYLKLFTFVPLAHIAATIQEHAVNPGLRKAQHLLAHEVLSLVHGSAEADKIRAEHEAMRNPATLRQLHNTDSSTAAEAEQALPKAVLPQSLVLNTPFPRLLYHAGFVSSKSEGARIVANGGLYVRQVGEARWVVVKDQQKADLSNHVEDGHLILRMGKWKVRMVEVLKDAEYEAAGHNAAGWAEYKAANKR